MAKSPRAIALAASILALLVATPTSGSAAKKKKKWDIEQPHAPSRTAPIDTRTGTWMNLDVSPDGKWIVFDLLGDLYLLPIGGGAAKALTHGLAWDMQPRFSPDGRWVAFTSDRAGGDNIWVIRTDGKAARAITKEPYRLLSAPDWAPDGRTLVARKHFTSRRSIGAGEMWLYHLKGGKGLQMTKRTTDQKDEGEPVFSPDGRYLYYSRDVTPGPRFKYGRDASAGIYGIERLDRKTGEIIRVTGGPGGAVRPTPSPDGKWLAFVRRDRGRSALYVRHLKSGKERKLVGKLERDLQETWAIHGVYPAMAWTPKSDRVVYWAGGTLHAVSLATGAVKPIPFHVKSTRRLIKPLRFPVVVAPDRFDVKMLRWVSVAPNGKTVAFQALGHIYVRSLPDGKPRRLTKQKDHFELYPAFTRDSKRIVYVSWNDAKLGRVRIADVRKGKSRVLTPEPGHYIAPALSPDGRILAYQRVPGGWLTSPVWAVKRGLFVRDLKAGKEIKISPAGRDPHFAATSDVLYYWERTAKDTRTFFRSRTDSQKRRALVQTKAATHFRLSPNGKWLTFVEGYQIHVTPYADPGRLRRLGPKNRAFPVVRFSKHSGFNPHFSGGSDRVYWSLGPTLYEAPVAERFLAGGGKKVKASKPKAHLIGFTAPHAKPRGVVAIVGAKVVTMRGDQVIPKGTIVIRGNRIVAVGPSDKVRPPKGAKQIDGTGLTAMPGIIDVHAHGAQAAYGITPQRSWLNYGTLAFGVTTIHDPSNHSESVFAAGELVKAGRAVGPRIYSTGTILYGASGSYRAEVNSLADARGHVARQQAMGAVTVKSYNQPRRNQRQQVVKAARALKMMVMPEGGALFQHNMSMVVDGHTGIEHAIPIANAYDDVIQLWARSGVGYTPTFNVAYGGLSGENYWYQERPIYAHKRLLRFVPRRWIDARARRPHKAPLHEWNHFAVARFAKRFVDAGGRVQVGGHGQREGLGAHWEIWAMVQGGFTTMQALRAATLDGARYVGLDADLGRIEKGKLADIILIAGDPLADIRVTEKVRYTVANGVVFEAATMAQILPKKVPAPRFFFTGGGRGGAVNVDYGRQFQCPVCQH